ncbi:MAG: MqnA/MqnD/SBP family protein [Planctomycetota bacterium]
MEPIRVAAVRYLNTLPLIEGLESVSGCELELTAPSRIAGLVRSGDADIGLVSIVDLASQPGAAETPLIALPVGMIGCDGPTQTVRLYSQTPPSAVTKLHADTDSHTSVLLARLLLRAVHGANAETVDFDVRERVARAGAAAAEEWPETLLMIGDKVITDAPEPERYAHEIDLGEAWHAWTALPFVYAVWACRASAWDEGDASRRRLQMGAALLERQRLHNRARLDAIARQRAPEHRWPIDRAIEYIGERLRYDFDDGARRGAERFFAEAHAAGLLPSSQLRVATGVSPAPTPT